MMFITVEITCFGSDSNLFVNQLEFKCIKIPVDFEMEIISMKR